MRLIPARLAIVAAALLAMAADPGGCDPTPPPYDACTGKACGEWCNPCPPDGGACLAVMGQCDPAGECVTSGAVSCNGPYDPCSGKACGSACTYDPPCRYADPPCMMPSYAGYCGPDSQCWPQSTPPDCAPPPPSWGCDGKACGEPCGYCPPDADPATCPVPTFAATACNDKGECVTEGTFTCPPVDPCAGKTCGDLCNPCAPAACMTAVVTACDPSGSCVPQSPGMCNPYDPCAGKACGDGCNLCPPGDPTCAEPMYVKACDASGQCLAAGSFTCGPGDACTSSGGTIVTWQCCSGATDFPNTCLIGACGCAATYSTPHQVCACPAGQCFDGKRCVSFAL